MSDSQRHILIYGTDGAFPSCRKGFLGTRNGLFEVTGGCVPACVKGVLRSRNGLFRVTVRAGARRKRIGMRFLYTANTFAIPVFEKNNVKIFYFPSCMNIHLRKHGAQPHKGQDGNGTRHGHGVRHRVSPDNFHRASSVFRTDARHNGSLFYRERTGKHRTDAEDGMAAGVRRWSNGRQYV